MRSRALRMTPMIGLLTVLYVLCALALGLYTAGQALLLWRYWRTRALQPRLPRMDDPPPVTVQLPLYNEANVALRLIDAVAAMDYPRDKLLLQVLDDSTDRTTGLVRRKLAKLRAAGSRVQHIRRGQRSGFKAGALAAGLQRSAGRLHCHLRRRLHPAVGLPAAHAAPFGQPTGSWASSRAAGGISMLTRTA